MNTEHSGSAQEGQGPPGQAAEDLVIAARREPAQSSRSRLAPCTEVIFVLREKRWSFAAITAWLERHGVHVAESTVQRFYRTQRRYSTREDPHPAADDHPATSPSNPTHETHQSPNPRSSTRSVSRPKYNTDF